METLRFERRFRGFDHGALGGYAAGAVAKRIDGPAEVNLRSLPPMERELELKESGEGYELHDGETLVLEAKPAGFELEVPGPIALTEAEAAHSHLLHDEVPHLYPGCFTCGPGRAEGDGLRLFMGRAERDGLITSDWTPHPGLAEGDALPAEMIWGALDCPAIWASAPWPEGAFPVLARQRLEVIAPVPLGERAIVSAWEISEDGRKHINGAAIHDSGGGLLARCEVLLVEVSRPPDKLAAGAR